MKKKRKEDYSMKKYFALFCALLLLLTGVALADEILPPAFEWERNIQFHWQVNEAGERMHMEAHALDDALYCAVCGSEVWDWGDGGGDVSNFDDHGNLLRYSSFEADGTMTYDSAHIITYDENGVMIKDQEYLNGIMYGEYTYAAGPEGFPIPVTMFYFYEDGSGAKCWFDAQGNEVRMESYDEQGMLISETIREYAQDEEGWTFEAKTTIRFVEGEEFYTEYNRYGDETRKIYTEADGTVWLDRTYEYEYQDGTKVLCKVYEDGMLVRESFYDENGFNVKDIEYQEDGSFTEVFYDEEDDGGFWDFFGDWLN